MPGMEQPPVVTVSGTAQRKADPDSFALSVTVEVRGSDAAEVNEQLAERFGRVDATLSPLSSPLMTIDRGPVSIHRNVSPPESRGSPAVEWLASRGVTLTDRDTSQASAMLETVGTLADEIDGLVLNGPHWQLDDDNAVHAAVQADAVQAALLRARRYAEAVGGRLGRLVQISDPGVQMARGVRLMAAVVSPGQGLGGMDFSPQPVEVGATVEGQWTIELS